MQEKMSSQVGVISALSGDQSKEDNNQKQMPPPDIPHRKLKNNQKKVIGEEPTSTDLIEMAANQCLKESDFEQLPI